VYLHTEIITTVSSNYCNKLDSNGSVEVQWLAFANKGTKVHDKQRIGGPAEKSVTQETAVHRAG
jgi:hypothetical protein